MAGTRIKEIEDVNVIPSGTRVNRDSANRNYRFLKKVTEGLRMSDDHVVLYTTNSPSESGPRFNDDFYIVTLDTFKSDFETDKPLEE
jgi:hypothetical protein